MKLKEIIEKIKSYLKETLSEMKKVVWPNQRYVGAATVIILVIVFILSVMVLFIDWSFAKIFGILLKV